MRLVHIKLIFNRTDIFIISDSQTGYWFNANLTLQLSLDLNNFGQFTTSCHGFHSNLLVCGSNDGSLKLINPQTRVLIKEICLGSCISEISMNQTLIMAGTVDGAVYLWDHAGNCILSFRAHDYVHSVSISDSRILAAMGRRVYIWGLDRHGRPFGPKSYDLKPEDDILWACFSPFGRQAESVPFLVGKQSYGSKTERDFRPMIKQRYAPAEGEHIVAVTGGRNQYAKIRDLESKRVLWTVRLREDPHMVWLNQESLFVVYPGANNLEMIPLIKRQSTVPGSACLESVSLFLPTGP